MSHNHSAVLLLIIPSSFVYFLSFLCFYTDPDADDKSKINTIWISNKTATCVKCGSPFKKLVEVQLPSEISDKFNNSETGTDAATAA